MSTCCKNFRTAIANKHEKCLTEIYEKVCLLNPGKVAQYKKYIFRYALKTGSLDIAKAYYPEIGDASLNNGEVFNVAIMNGQYDSVVYLKEHYAFFNPKACNIAAKYGHANILQYINENSFYKANAATFNYAVMKGNVDCVKYLISIGCEKGDNVFDFAARSKNLECMKLVAQNGGFMGVNVFKNAFMHSNIECITYLYKCGCALGDYLNYSLIKENAADSVHKAQKKAAKRAEFAEKLAALKTLLAEDSREADLSALTKVLDNLSL